MLKTIVTVILLLVFNILAARGFASQLEAVSASRAKRDEDVERRSLELGWMGRAVLAAIFFVVGLVVMISSNLRILSFILAIVLLLVIVAGNIYLRFNGLRLFPTFFFLWISTTISASTYAHFTSSDPIGIAYSVVVSVLFIIFVVSTIVMNVKSYYNDHCEEDDEAEKLSRKVKRSKSEDSDEADDGEDDGEDWPEEELRKERMLELAMKVLLVVIFIAAAVLLAVFLEVKFDFLPPYRF